MIYLWLFQNEATAQLNICLAQPACFVQTDLQQRIA